MTLNNGVTMPRLGLGVPATLGAAACERALRWLLRRDIACVVEVASRDRAAECLSTLGMTVVQRAIALARSWPQVGAPA